MKHYSRALYSPLLLLIALASPSTGWSKRQVIDRSVVTVNDEIILDSDISEFRKKTKSQNFQDLFGGLDPKKLEDRDALLQLLIEEKIIDQQVKKLELSASDAEVERHIRSILERNGITEGQLKARLKELGTDFAEYKSGIRRQLERRNLVDREIRPMMEISDEELRHFLLRSGQASDAKVYELAHILISGTGPKSKERAEKVLPSALANPTSFAALAEETSDDSATAQSGGELGSFTLEAMLTAFHEAARKTKAGKVFPKVIRTAAGYHIVKIVSSKPMSLADLPEERKAELRNQLMSQELEKKMALWLERKKSDAHIRRSAIPLGKELKSGS